MSTVNNEDLIKQLIANKLFDEAEALSKQTGIPINTTSSTEEWLDKFITQDSEMLALKDKVRKLSLVNDPVLIRGETGTGKELLAHALHGKRVGNFIAINCAGMPENLIESELFGHVAGAFTGATKDKVGLMEAAKGGTLFLDEVGELLPTLQSKLLRAIQEMSIRRVGDNTERKISCRIVSATHQMIDDECNSFRRDLFYRINTFNLYITPLCTRPDDIPLIVKYLDPKCPSDKIDPYKLHGNVRSLQKIVRHYQVLGEVPQASMSLIDLYN